MLLYFVHQNYIIYKIGNLEVGISKLKLYKLYWASKKLGACSISWFDKFRITEIKFLYHSVLLLIIIMNFSEDLHHPYVCWIINWIQGICCAVFECRQFVPKLWTSSIIFVNNVILFVQVRLVYEGLEFHNIRLI